MSLAKKDLQNLKINNRTSLTEIVRKKESFAS